MADMAGAFSSRLFCASNQSLLHPPISCRVGNPTTSCRRQRAMSVCSLLNSDLLRGFRKWFTRACSWRHRAAVRMSSSVSVARSLGERTGAKLIIPRSSLSPARVERGIQTAIKTTARSAFFRHILGGATAVLFSVVNCKPSAADCNYGRSSFSLFRHELQSPNDKSWFAAMSRRRRSSAGRKAVVFSDVYK